jgi:hypothetical protein
MSCLQRRVSARTERPFCCSNVVTHYIARYCSWHASAIKMRLNRYCHAASLLGMTKISSLDGCSKMTESFEECLADGQCPCCVEYAGDLPTNSTLTCEQFAVGFFKNSTGYAEPELTMGNELEGQEESTPPPAPVEAVSLLPTPDHLNASFESLPTLPPSLISISQTTIPPSHLVSDLNSTSESTNSPSTSIPSIANLVLLQLYQRLHCQPRHYRLKLHLIR